MAAWGDTVSGMVYRGHTIRRDADTGGFVVEPYGAWRASLEAAQRWVDAHIQRERAYAGTGAWSGPSVASLRADVQRAIANAPVGAASLVATPHPAAMLEPPQNAAGAHFRAAYWLAVGARPANGAPMHNATLLNAAKDALAKADAASAVTLFALRDEPVGPILQRAETLLERAHRYDAAAVLNSLRGASSQAASGAVWRGRTAAIAVPIIGAVGLGLAAWAVAPYVRMVQSVKAQAAAQR